MNNLFKNIINAINMTTPRGLTTASIRAWWRAYTHFISLILYALNILFPT